MIADLDLLLTAVFVTADDGPQLVIDLETWTEPHDPLAFDDTADRFEIKGPSPSESSS